MINSASQKRLRIRTTARLYAMLRRVVLERDGWRCQQCGSPRNLDVHHMRRRSALGDDAETNLITLCRKCHQSLHGFPSPRIRRQVASARDNYEILSLPISTAERHSQSLLARNRDSRTQSKVGKIRGELLVMKNVRSRRNK